MLPVPGNFTRAVVYILVAIFLYDLQSVIVKFLGSDIRSSSLPVSVTCLA